MDALTGLIPEHWIAWLTFVVTVCAALTTVLPPPKSDSGTIYRIIYNVLQWVALNLGRAKNAQDTPNLSISKPRP